MSERCKARVWRNWNSYQCTRKATADGYCKQHHPDTVAERDRKSQERFDEKVKNSAYARLRRANERLAVAEKLIADCHHYVVEDNPTDYVVQGEQADLIERLEAFIDGGDK